MEHAMNQQLNERRKWLSTAWNEFHLFCMRAQIGDEFSKEELIDVSDRWSPLELSRFAEQLRFCGYKGELNTMKLIRPIKPITSI